MDNAEIIIKERGEEHRPFIEPEIGQWYWVKQPNLY